MAKVNTSPASIYTHEGARAQRVNYEQQLRRSVMSCMLWEKEFYEDGETIAKRIVDTIPHVAPEKVASIAIEARKQMKLRHVPLLIVREMARCLPHSTFVAKTLPQVIDRADELAEFLAMYWKDGKQPLSAQVKRGLADAFTKFDAYQLAKYNRDGKVKLRDVLFLCHAKPKDAVQAETWKKLIDGTLESPDTWEVALSSGADKKETWERLLRENVLGGLALLRNLRNMEQAGVDEKLIIEHIQNMHTNRILPFRFIAAAQFAPHLESYLEDAMFRCLSDKPKLRGKTVILVDVSGSMHKFISEKSDMSRMDAACGVAMCGRELCEDASIITFSAQVVRISPRRGFALRDTIRGSQEFSHTYLGHAIREIDQSIHYDRIIVVTDEQSHDPVPLPKGRGYMINIAFWSPESCAPSASRSPSWLAFPASAIIRSSSRSDTWSVTFCRKASVISKPSLSSCAIVSSTRFAIRLSVLSVLL